MEINNDKTIQELKTSDTTAFQLISFYEKACEPLIIKSVLENKAFTPEQHIAGVAKKLAEVYEQVMGPVSQKLGSVLNETMNFYTEKNLALAGGVDAGSVIASKESLSKRIQAGFDSSLNVLSSVNNEFFSYFGDNKSTQKALEMQAKAAVDNSIQPTFAVGPTIPMEKELKR